LRFWPAGPSGIESPPFLDDQMGALTIQNDGFVGVVCRKPIPHEIA
jgi:hypothetical protein